MNNIFNTNVLIGKTLQEGTDYICKVDANLFLFIERQDDHKVVRRIDEPMFSHRINVVIERGYIIEAFFDAERKVPKVKFDCDALVGCTVSDATIIVQNDGKFTNITKLDGEFIEENLDLCRVPGRVNFEVENGMVVRASGG